MNDQAKPNSEHPHRLPGYVPDDPAGVDFLGFELDVNAVAALVTSRTVSPPISIGLFGTEGSGKTFFLWMLKRRIQQICEGSRAAGDSSSFINSIAQVEYNAWHNVGINPWMGLAETVFSSLDRLVRNNAQAPWEPEQSPFFSIGTARKLFNTLESEVKRTRALVEQAQAHFRSAEKEHAAAMRAHAEHTARPKWLDVETHLSESLSLSRNAPVREEIDKAGHALGLKHLSGNPEQLENVLEQAKTLGGRAGLLTSSQKVKQYFGTVFLSLLVVFLTILLASVSITLYVSDPDVKNWLKTLRDVLAVISALITLLGGWFILVARSAASRAIETLQEHEDFLHEITRQVDEEKAFDLAVAQHRIQSLRDVLDDGRARLARTEQEHSLATQAFKDFERDGPLRRVSDYYREQFLSIEEELRPSIIPTIREDFRDLMEIVLAESQEAPHPYAGKPDIERIVVFVDDLDQCPPQTVIAVLQAIHLLLMFPIFVVVVAANPRWLLDAVRSKFPGHEALDPRLRSLAYLNKLIQIPFWVRPVDRAVASELIWHMVPVEKTAMPDAISEPAPPIEELADDTLMEGLRPPEDIPIDPEMFRTTFEQLTPAEVAFMGEIAELLPSTPRHLKRLANTYRLIRNTQSSDRLLAIVGDRNARPAYPAVLTQLAIVVFAPLLAPRFLQVLWEMSPHQSCDLKGLIQALAGDPEFSDSEHWSQINALLGVYGQRGDDAQAVVDLRTWNFDVMRHAFFVPENWAKGEPH